jgi:hypothetical protein
MSHPSNKITTDNLKDVVYWHRPQDTQVRALERIAESCEILMHAILISAPDCADRSTALRCAREARMWANAAIMLDPQEKAEIDHTRGNG